MTNHNEQQNHFWVGFLLGGMIAGSAVFLMGTKRGKQLLEQLLEKIEEHEEGLADTVDTLKDKSAVLLEKTQEVKEAVIKQLETKKEEVPEEIATHIDQALTAIEDVQKQGVALTEEVHHKFFKKDGKSLTS